MESDACAAFCRWILDGLWAIGRFAIGGRTAYRKTRNASDQRQQPFELGRLCHADMITQRRYLIADTLKGVAEPVSVDDKATSNGGALGLIANESDVHVRFKV